MLTIRKQQHLFHYQNQKNVGRNRCYVLVFIMMILWSVTDYVYTQNETATAAIVNSTKTGNVQHGQVSEVSAFNKTQTWTDDLDQQQQTDIVETEPTVVIRNSSWDQSNHDGFLPHETRDSFRTDTVNSSPTSSGTNLPPSTFSKSEAFSFMGTKPLFVTVTESDRLRDTSQMISTATKSDTTDGWTVPVSYKPKDDIDSCFHCNWTQIHSHSTHLTEPEGRVQWTELAQSCWCIHELSWHITPASDKQGIVLHFTDFNIKWYERLEVYARGRHIEEQLLFRHPDLTTAVLLLPHSDISVWVRAMPWPFFTVENAPSSFTFNYSTHPLHLMPTALSDTHTTYTRVAPLVADDDLYECSSVTIPAYILCDKVQQCVGGEDEPADCPYRSVSCGHPWFLHHDRCLQVVITSTKDVPQPCDPQSGGKLAVLPAPIQPKLLEPVIARSGISSMCLAVNLTYKPIFSSSIQMESQYRHMWQWGQGIMNHGQLQQRGIQLDSKLALFFSQGKVSAIMFYGSECDHNISVVGFLCMKDNVSSTDMEANTPLSIRLPLNNTYNNNNNSNNNNNNNNYTAALPATVRLKNCTDGSFVFQFQRCPQNNKGQSWSPNNFKLFDCTLRGQVHYALVCDGHSDCDDGSDETGCAIPTDISILQSYHVCANGQLIPVNKKNYMCDGAIDCLDQSDERLCTTCTEGTVLCPGFGCRPPGYADFLDCATSDTADTPSDPAVVPGVDLVIIFHSTSAQTDSDYQFFAGQLTLMLKTLNSSGVHVRLGFMLFDSQAHVQFNLKDLSDIAENDIKNMTLLSSGGTNIAEALHSVRMDMFSAQNGDRSDASDVILLVIDAVSDMNTTDVIKKAKEAKGQGIYILAMGVGVTDVRELRSIVSWPQRETLFLIRDMRSAGEPLYKIAFALLPLGKLPLPVDKPRREVMNVALSKPTTWNSPNLNKYLDARYAVDGTRVTCARSDGENLDPYRVLRVDLLGDFEIYGVVISGDACCGAEMLWGFYIFVTTIWADPPASPQNSSDLCLYHAKHIPRLTTVRLECTQIKTGRYVTLVKYGNIRKLAFCEIQVLGIPVLASTLSNVALKKPVSMSSYDKISQEPVPENAVDGIRGFHLHQCARTSLNDLNPYRWLRVDLLGLFEIYSVIITNRGDCCGHFLANFYIFVTMTSAQLPEAPTNSRDLCLNTKGNYKWRTTIGLPCSQLLRGRYVTIVMYTKDVPISVCEMQVLGIPLLESWNRPQSIYPPAVVHMDGLGLSTAVELKKGQEICPETHFQCVQGFCIPTYLLNNGIIDCPFGEDENIADLRCPGFFRCWMTGNCLHPVYYCDGVNHCPFNEDERYCGQEHCPDQCVCEGQAFRCSSGFDYQAYFQLRYLDLSGSTNPDLQGSEFLTYLQYLNLSSCDMVEVELSSLNQLRILDVSHNSIHSFDFLKLSHLSELLHLNLSFNPLSKLMDPDFSNFVHRTAFMTLESLVMMDMGLDTIMTKGLTGSTQISVLDIRHNPVDKVQTKVFGTSVRVLYTDSLKLCCHHFHVTQLAECHAPVDELSSCSDLLKSDFLRVLLWILSTMALVGNVGVWIYRTFIEQQGTSLAYKVMVINLSASDFLMGVYMAIVGMADMTFRGIYVLKEEQWRHAEVCKIAGFLAIVSSEMSAFVICLITIDRFLLLRFPFSLRFRFSKLSASVACCITWGVAVVLATLPLFVSHWKFYSQNSICVPLPITRRQFPGQQYAFSVFIILNFIISTVIGVGQVMIYHTIRQSSKGLQKDSRNQDITIARRLFLIVITDFCCWFPIGLMGLLVAQGTHISDLVNVWAGVFVLPLNSALNPFLYTLNTLLERRARHVERKRIEKVMTNLNQQMRTWSSEKMLEHVRKCLNVGLLAKEDVLQLAAHCPDSSSFLGKKT